jgi:hypothetical protein
MEAEAHIASLAAMVQHIPRIGPTFPLGLPGLAGFVFILARDSGSPGNIQAMKVITNARFSDGNAFASGRGGEGKRQQNGKQQYNDIHATSKKHRQ